MRIIPRNQRSTDHIFFAKNEDARFMNMQALLEKSPTTSTKVVKDPMDRTREKHAAVAVATPNRLTKTKPKQRARQSGRRASGRGGKCTRVQTDDERDSEDEGEQYPLNRLKVLPTTRNRSSCSLR